MKLKYTGVFSHMEKSTIDSITSAVYGYLSGKTNSIPLPGDALPFGQQFEKIVTAPGLREYAMEDAGVAKQVTDEMAEMMQQAREEMIKEEPFAAERKALQQMEAATKQTFEQQWNPAEKILTHNYLKEEIDTEFYKNEFGKTMGGQHAVMFDSVKLHLTRQWAGQLQQKQIQYEQKVFDRHATAFANGVAEKIRQMQEVRDDLADLIPDLNGLYSMVMGKGKGKWKPRDSRQQQVLNGLFEGKSNPGGQDYGGGEEKLKKNPFNILQQFAKMLKGNASIEKLAETLGRQSKPETEFEEELFMRTIFKPEYKADYAAKSDITGVRESDDIGNMLSSEKVLLCDPLLENLFYKKFTEKKLQTYEYRGRYLTHVEDQLQDKRQKVKESPKGPFIICVDTSGSMSGLPETVAKVLSYAIVKNALKEKRKVYLINFSSGIETRDLSSVEDAVNGLIDFLSLDFCGGTDVDPALAEALRMLQIGDYKKSDVLIVSDFIIADLDGRTLTQLANAKKNKTKFHCMVIGSSSNARALAGFDTMWFYDEDLKGIVRRK